MKVPHSHPRLAFTDLLCCEGPYFLQMVATPHPQGQGSQDTGNSTDIYNALCCMGLYEDLSGPSDGQLEGMLLCTVPGGSRAKPQRMELFYSMPSHGSPAHLSLSCCER